MPRRPAFTDESREVLRAGTLALLTAVTQQHCDDCIAKARRDLEPFRTTKPELLTAMWQELSSLAMEFWRNRYAEELGWMTDTVR